MRSLVAALSLVLLSAVYCKHGCLKGTHHKAAPGPETGMQACHLYANSSCCHSNFTEKISPSPLIQIDHFYWNRCGNLSKLCEDYMKKIECFYQCSPLTAHWAHPNISVAIQSVPLCRNFCDGWFEACRADLVCAHNFITDWTYDESGNQCKNDCVPYSKMFANGTDLCESAWGSSFVVSTSPCRCLDMTETDSNVVKYILEGEHSEESGEEQACKPRLQGPPRKKDPDQDDEDD
ncbi:PREDICTED: riboflavin-binding protein-like [Nanorana parkeri]|uniref:riboflavin-binding protein-like n=1 Tax=Nanorana parkeri TaxID=125878 RepID=UPI0008549442|nr:PREDICTED: riboflavin-binding protein-like [Nanorana parkeri]